jgi:hypothetical protein
MGPAAVLELTLLPRQWQDLPTVFDKNIIMGGACGDMTIAIAGTPCASGAIDGMTSSHSVLGWDPSMLQLLPDMEDQHDTEEEVPSDGGVFRSLEGKERKDALAAHFRSSVGGLQPQINAIVRRVLDGRSIYSTHPEDGTAKSAINRSRLEAEELLQLGLQPVLRRRRGPGLPGEADAAELVDSCDRTGVGGRGDREIGRQRARFPVADGGGARTCVLRLVSRPVLLPRDF